MDGSVLAFFLKIASQKRSDERSHESCEAPSKKTLNHLPILRATSVWHIATCEIRIETPILFLPLAYGLESMFGMKLARVGLVGLSILIFGSLSASYSQTSERSGAWLYHACLADIRMSDAPDGDAVSRADLDLSQRCIDYVRGFMDASSTGASRDYCPPDGVTMNTLIRLYVAHMQAHPKLMDEDRGVGMWGSLVASYPCPTRPK